MPELMRCKPCGYISRKDALRRVCPACGAPLTAFEPYEDQISATRRSILNLDLHPILVHTPQTFATFLPGLVLFTLLFPTFHSAELLAIVYFAALILPVSAIGAILSGLLDGKVKFKRLNTQLLVRKIVLGASLLIVSMANAAVIVIYGFQHDTRLVILFLGAAAFVCAVLLGLTGKKLILPVLRGR